MREFVLRHQPQVSVIPAGGARFDLGGDIIMGIEEAIEFTRLSGAAVLANHLEAISHCPTTRKALRDAAMTAGLGARLYVPEDGQTLEFQPA
ncbi:hypothetical protein [Pseudomonas sp. 7SR1]|uniref:hypothetical protein n=1 Tax=Pseudomonas sp. 7SR1 TaxID=1881017 RepID=UPI001E3BC181|nr:hypothetical protein [Pseudomonas sp. 7SR1]